MFFCEDIVGLFCNARWFCAASVDIFLAQNLKKIGCSGNTDCEALQL